MLKKVMSVGFSFLLIVTVAITGTLAYKNLSAWDWAQQTDQTVKIKLVQEQRAYDDEGNVIGLESFADYPQLVPLVESAQYNGSNFDCYGMPTAEGYVDQIIRIKSEGTADAYVRVIVAIPSALDDENDAGHNALHWNLGNRFMPDGTFSNVNDTNSAFDNVSWKFEKAAFVEGIKCNLYSFTYQEPLSAGATTEAAAFVGFYLDDSVNIVNGHLMLDGVDTGFTDSNVKIFVKAQAVQSYGFENANEAFSAAELSDNPWLGDFEQPYVQSHEELKAALAAGWEEIIFANGIIHDETVTVASQIQCTTDAAITLDFNGKVITSAADRSYNGNNIYFRFENTDVTITGNGSMIAEVGKGDSPVLILGYTYSKVTIESGYFNAADGRAVWANSGSYIVINGGTFESFGDDDGEELIFANGDSTIEINGGFFRRDTPSLTLNEKNGAGTIIVRGGTFVNYDPSHGNDGNYVAEGYKVISEEQDNGEIWYTVVPE